MSTGPTAARQKRLLRCSLYERVRDVDTLLTAWRAIQRNGETSRSPRTRDDTKRFAAELPKHINSLQRKLRRGDYAFTPQIGATPAKANGKGKRPLVIAPIADRIVQRAILDVMQEAEGLLGVREVLSTPTSIGGIRGRGVENALALIDSAYARGEAAFVAGSDISGFFTQVRQTDVVEFVREQAADDDFVALLERALRVELANANEMDADDLRLFPTDDIGVAQGCPLSAFAGNVALRHFDRQMNGKGIICVRYIDDFMLAGGRKAPIEKAFESAAAHLGALNMQIYRPGDGSGKAFMGPITQGFDFLGHRVSPGVYPPSQRNVERFLASIRDEVELGRAHILRTLHQRDAISRQLFSQTIDSIDERTRAWIGSFRASRCLSTATKIDVAVDQILSEFIAFYRAKTDSLDRTDKRRVLGVLVLADEIRQRRLRDVDRKV